MAVRVRWLVGTLLLLCGVALVATPAGAEPPQRLGPAVTDLAEVLSPADEAQVQASLDELRAQEGIQLFVAYVDTFDGSGAQEWAAETARLSQLGDDDALLAVAVQDRAYAYDVAGDFPLSDEQLARIASRDVEPLLAQDDWAGAAVAFADGMQSALGGSGFPWLPVLAALAVLAVAAAWLLRRRRGRGQTPAGVPAGGPPPVSVEALTTQAAQALIETDDAIRTSIEELGFAQAQFGEQNTARFATTIDHARADLAAAFAVQQKLDDEVPETDEQRRAMLTEIVQRCQRANEALDAQAAEFDRLRDLEATAPQVLAALPGRIQQARTEATQARDLVANLARTYAAAELAAIADNPGEAEQRLTFAEQQVQAATDDMAGGRPGEAVVAVVAAESAVGQASQLAEAVRRLQADLEAAAAALPALQAEIGQELQVARAVPVQDVDTRPAVAAAEQALTAAAAEAGGLAAPVAALRRLQEADAALDAVLATAQQAGQQRAAAAAVLEQTITAARAEIAATGDFIATRRGAVGSQARTRLAEAERHLERAVALVGSDPRQALAHAQQADGLAGQALQLAQSDVSRARPEAVGGRGGFDIGSAVLGGILIDAISGGLGGRGGFSPSRGGGSRGGMFGGGGRATGSFGGSATRARRGGGGRF